MKFYDFIVLGSWVTSFAFVHVNKEFIQGAITVGVLLGYLMWRIKR